jgi:hypothetical protein
MIDDIYPYIHNRMREMGYSKGFHMEAVYIRTSVDNKTIYAPNEYYYLISESVPPSLVILSDTNIFTDAAYFGNFSFNNFQEFSGTIEISQDSSPIELEFIRVIPR